ncbi:MAG: hypothetical protein LUE20_06360 [Oscillospiraceae bacterium]|nr:hypothetical protein [Oscillospiraceae bacterium]
MKAVSMEELRTVDGGKIRYRTLCYGLYFYDTVGGLISANLHYSCCSQCRANKKVKGYWYTFA